MRYVRGAAARELVRLVPAVEIILSRQTEEVEPVEEVFSSLDDLVISGSFTTLQSTVDNVDGRGERIGHLLGHICAIRLEEARHDVVHTRLWLLRCHVEPETSCHGCVAVARDCTWVPQKHHLTIIAVS